MSYEKGINDTLQEYCSIGDEEEVEKAIRNGAVINSQNRVNGWTGLHSAARREHVGIVKVLLANGADVNARNNKGEKPVDMTTNKEIIEILEQSECRKETAKEKDNKKDIQPADMNKVIGPGSVSFVPGYLTNTVFPYTLATANPVTSGENSHSKEPSVLVPGYLAKPVYAVAAGRSVIQESTTSSEALQKETPVNFVPGYLANPVFPAMANNESSEEFKPIFVPHVEQFGSLVNSYVNSLHSLEKPVEYRMCDSCKTTPVATVCVGPNVSEIVVKVRKANSDDKDFVEVDLNRKILTYDELLDVCAKEFRISRSDIVKVRKLPNTLIRRDKDVKRLQPYQELEIFVE
eukprot:gene10991-12154_t